MPILAKSLRAALLGAATLLPLAAPLAAETVKLTLLGVGDVYNFAENKGRGGFARLNAVAKAERANNPNTIYVFDGDMLSPSLISGFDLGQNTIDLTNIVPFDLAVPGNHEFDFGPDNFYEKAKASKYPWAAINITKDDGSAIDGLGGVMVKEVGGLKVALIPVAAGALWPVSGILLSPVFAAGAMALSSVFVLGNALRLRRFRAPMAEFPRGFLHRQPEIRPHR